MTVSMIVEKIDRTIEFDIAFDVLDAAIHRCLGNTVRGFVDFEREAPTHATIVYLLSQYQIGVFGKIRIDKLGIRRTEMSFFEFREPFTPKQKQKFFDGDDSLKNKTGQLLIEGLDNYNSLSERRKRHYGNVVETLLNKLAQENIWSEKQNENQSLKGDITIGKNMIDSTIIKGNNNIININSKKSKRK